MGPTDPDDGAGPLDGERLACAGDEARLAEASLVLDSMGIRHRLEPLSDGWGIFVREEDLDVSRRALAQYDLENPPPAAVPPPPSVPGGTLAGAAMGAALLAFHAAVRGSLAPERWLDRGVADSARILGGEPWRAVTALTLHADVPHVLGNAVAAFIFVGAVCRWLGPGLGLWLVLVAGAAGNALNALLMGPGHVSLGASTATFGALGILGALQVVHRRHFAQRRLAWAAFGASVALLAVLGMGPRSDVTAHALGLLTGALLGALAGLSLRRRSPPGRATQLALVAATVAVIAASWSR